MSATLTLRRVEPPARGFRPVAAIVSLVLGLGLLGGAAAGFWLTGGGTDPSSPEAVFDDGRSLWHELTVDDLFPPELIGESTGPGGADRRWERVAVAPDSDCSDAFDPTLAQDLALAGCHRLLRANYVDDTQTSVTTVGLLFTEADHADTQMLAAQFGAEEGELDAAGMPQPYAALGTVTASFGAEQRATWTVRILTDVPVIAYAVTGFADGRTVDAPQPAVEAVTDGQETAIALAGLGHESQAIADRIERRLRGAAQERAAQSGGDGEAAP